MSTLPRVLVVLFIAVASFVAGVYVTISKHWFQPLVTVSVANASGQEIQSLVVTHASYGTKGRIESPPPKPGDTTVIHFFHQGEGSFQIDALLADGKALHAVGGYIEPGYRLSFKVSPNEIAGGFIGGL
ncbi:MAG: hypothetical protein Q8K52_03410 [Thiobacillus sp.]|nr:hypothetical protein [Thiobacillus sp.]